MKRSLTASILLLLFILLAGCNAPTPEPTATIPPTPEPSATPEPTDAPTEEPTVAPTETPEPSTTPPPSPTPTEPPTVEPTLFIPTPTPIAAVTEAPSQPPAGQSFVPAAQTVYQLDNDPYSVVHGASCPNEVNFNFYGLVAVAPLSGSVRWERQDGTLATLQEASLNNYFGAVPGFMAGFDLQIAVSFTSPTTLVVSHSLVSQSDGSCRHVFDYRAKTAW